MQNFFIVILICLYSLISYGQVEEIEAKKWPGLSFPQNEGGLLLTLIPSKGLLKLDAGVTILKLFGAKTQKIYLLQYDIGMDFNSPRPWQLPSGTYKILQMIVNTKSGFYQYKGPHIKSLMVSDGKISDAGKWFVIERSGRNLVLIPKPENPSAKAQVPQKVPTEIPVGTDLSSPKLPSTRQTQAVQKNLVLDTPKLPSQSRSLDAPSDQNDLNDDLEKNTGAKKVKKKKKKKKKLSSQIPSQRVEQNRGTSTQMPPSLPKAGTGIGIQEQVAISPSDRQKILPKIGLPSDQTSRDYRDVRAVYTFKQTISMFYKIDLKKYNKFAPKMQRIIQSHEPKLRKCYADQLEVNEQIKGLIHFKFLYSKAEKSFRTLKVIGQTVNEPKFVECVYWELSAINFPLKIDMIGDITFFYDVK